MFSVGDVSFVTAFAPVEGDAYTIVKLPEHVARYEALLADLERPNILEVGMAYGGSMVWLNEVAKPRRLVGVDINVEPIARLEDYIAERGSPTVSSHYGVDQSDRATIRAIAMEQFDGPLDLVIDDASHEYRPSLSLFETVFPLLRPGGIYVLEDWRATAKWAQALETKWAQASETERTAMGAEWAEALGPESDRDRVALLEDYEPLTKLALELVLARSEQDDLIDEVRFDDGWCSVIRGGASIDPETFRLESMVRDHAGLLRR